MRQFEKTHPWLTFSVDLRDASPSFWLLLGEIQSKCEHIAGVPLKKDVADRLHRLYLAKGVMATTAIEGNTLSEDEVLQRIEGRLNLPLSKEYQGQEIDNIVASCNQISRRMLDGESGQLTTAMLKEFNFQILDNLPEVDEKIPGQIREVSVGVGHYRGAPAEDCEYLLDRMCQWLNEERQNARPDMKIAMGVIRAILAHLYLVWIHPFNDGNGRTARMIELQILLEVGVPTPAAHLLSNHYNQTRSEYYRHLALTSQAAGDVLPFIQYALQGFVDGLREQVEIIRGHQWDVMWRDYVFETFRNQKKNSSELAGRRRDLTLALSEKRKAVPISELKRLSPEVAEHYAGKTGKTLVRDIHAIVDLGLVEVTPAGVRARTEIILAFLPKRTLRS